MDLKQILKTKIQALKKLKLFKKEFIIFNISDNKIKVIFWQNKEILKKVYPLESNIIINGFLINEGELTKIVSKIRQDLNLPSQKIIKSFINIETTDFYVFPLSFFEVPRENMAEIIKLNIKNLIPFNINDIYFNYKIYGYDEETQKRKVSVFVVKKNLIDSYTNFFIQHNFLTLFIGIDAFNLADLLISKIILEYNDSYIFAFGQQERLSLIFIDNLQIKVIWSEDLLKNTPLNIVSSFQKHLAIIEKSDPNRIFLFVPPNQKEDYEQIFKKFWPEKEIKLPEESFEEWFVAEELVNQAPKFPYLKFMNFISLFPEKEYLILRTKEQLSFWILISIALLIILNFAFYLSFRYGSDLLEKLKQQTLTLSPSILEKYSFFKKEAEEFNTLLTKIKKEHQTFPYSEHLQLLAKIPEEVKINQVNFETNKLTIKASVKNTDDFNLFKKFLQSTSEIESFEIPLSKIEYFENINFEAIINLKPPKN